MANLSATNLGKIVNPDFALAALHDCEPHGEFKAYVRLAEPANQPANMRVVEAHAADMFNVRIRCDEIEHVVDDHNVLSVELREYVVFQGGLDV